MLYECQIQFVCNLLQNMHISSYISIDPSKTISSKIDLGLRSLIFGVENYTAILHNSMSEAKENTIYRFFDEYYCNYIFLRLPETKAESYFFIGPYLLEPQPEERIRKKMQSIGLSEEQLSQIYKYYANLPIVETENLLFTIAYTLGNSLWGTPEQYSIEYIDYMIPDHTSPICVSPTFGEHDSSFSLALLEANYANEKKLMDAVSQGKLHKVNAIASAVYNNGTEQRLSDSLRNRKNYLIILNTLLRKAAEYGGVHPLHINQTSSYFAKEIERIHSLNSSLHLQEEMIRDYCLLVKNHSLLKYSSLVGKAITLIHYDLLADLSLKSLASQLNVTPSYLSTLFKKECGCTLTDYVNRKRIEHAIQLLNETDKQIQNIAYESGIQDTNYFIRLFKKYTNLTPSQYRGTINKNNK